MGVTLFTMSYPKDALYSAKVVAMPLFVMAMREIIIFILIGDGMESVMVISFPRCSILLKQIGSMKMNTY